MSHSTPSPKHDRFDPLVVHAWLEAIVILAAFSTVSINHRIAGRAAGTQAIPLLAGLRLSETPCPFSNSGLARGFWPERLPARPN